MLYFSSPHTHMSSIVLHTANCEYSFTAFLCLSPRRLLCSCLLALLLPLFLVLRWFLFTCLDVLCLLSCATHAHILTHTHMLSTYLYVDLNAFLFCLMARFYSAFFWSFCMLRVFLLAFFWLAGANVSCFLLHPCIMPDL